MLVILSLNHRTAGFIEKLLGISFPIFFAPVANPAQHFSMFSTASKAFKAPMAVIVQLQRQALK